MQNFVIFCCCLKWRNKIDTWLVANIPTILYSISDLVYLHCLQSFLATFRDIKSAIWALKVDFRHCFQKWPLFKTFHPHHLSFRSLFNFYAFLERCSVYIIRNKWDYRFDPYWFFFPKIFLEKWSTKQLLATSQTICFFTFSRASLKFCQKRQKRQKAHFFSSY